MKLELPREKILEAVLTAERFSGKHLTLPIISSILFSCEKNTLTVKATNLDIGIEIYIPLKNSLEEWSCVVSAQALKSFLSNISSKIVHLEFAGSVLNVNTDDSSVSISVQLPDDFPIIPKVVDGERFELSPKVFVEGVNAVSYSASQSTIKPELSSIYIYPSNEEMIFVATDSFRLAEKRIKMPKKNIKDPILLPFKNAIEISRVIDLIGEDVDVVVSKNQISFKCGSLYISSRAVDGIFPDYKQIIPKDFVTEAILLKEDLSKALKLTGGFIDQFQQVVCIVDPKQHTLTFKTKGGNFGEALDTVKAKVTGESISITFNHRYVADCLQSIKSDSVVMKLVGPNRPVIITESSHPSFTYLVMPMNR